MARYIAIVDGKKGAYGVTFPDLPGCTSMGTTVDEALRNAVEAVRMWIEETIDQGGSIPEARSIENLRTDRDFRAEIAQGGIIATVPLLMDLARPARANISIDAGLLKAIDEAADAHNLTRSAYIASAVREKIEAGK
jgi:predicted RNase H-like HicB family nuclease